MGKYQVNRIHHHTIVIDFEWKLNYLHFIHSRGGGRGGGGFLVGACGSAFQTLTLFQNKICNFPIFRYPFSDLEWGGEMLFLLSIFYGLQVVFRTN